MSSLALRILVVITCGLLAVCRLTLAEDSSDKDWRSTATARLIDIYDGGVFRARNLNAEWLDDSSAYRIRERDPQTGEFILAQYEVASGSGALWRLVRQDNGGTNGSRPMKNTRCNRVTEISS